MANNMWNKLEDKSVLENKKSYFVAQKDTDMADYYIAQWLEKGTEVAVPLIKKEEKKNISEEEKLIREIFFGYSDIKIKEDGFYVITSDYGLDEKEYPNCAQIPVRISGDVWWSKLPEGPEGLMNINEETEKESKEIEEKQKKMDDLKHAYLASLSSDGGIIDQRLHGWKSWRNLWETKEVVEDRAGNVFKNKICDLGCIFEPKENASAITMAAAIQAVDAVCAIDRKLGAGMLLEAEKECINDNGTKLKKYVDEMTKIIKDNDTMGLSALPRTMLDFEMLVTSAYICSLHENTYGAINYYERLLSNVKFFNLKPFNGESMLYVSALRQVSHRLGMYARLDSLNAPSFVMRDGIRGLAKWMYPFFAGKFIGIMHDFEQYHNYYPDWTPVAMPWKILQ